MTRASFDIGLKKLHDDILKMSNITAIQIKESVNSLNLRDLKLARDVIKKDYVIDNMQKEIEEKCIKLIAMEQPLAKDLREIFTTIKIVTDLERIADHAVDISKVVLYINENKHKVDLTDICKMSEIVQEMIGLSTEAYVDWDVEKAYDICKTDDRVDNIYKNVFKNLLEYMVREPRDVTEASQLLFVSKHLERIGDYVTNICEWTIYLITGKFVDLND